MASVTSIYARALADVVFEKKLDGGKILAELRTLSALLHANPDLRRVWENPAIAAEQKRGVLDAIATREGISQPVRNFVAIVIDHRRMHFLTQSSSNCNRNWMRAWVLPRRKLLPSAI